MEDNPNKPWLHRQRDKLQSLLKQLWFWWMWLRLQRSSFRIWVVMLQIRWLRDLLPQWDNWRVKWIYEKPWLRWIFWFEIIALLLLLLYLISPTVFWSFKTVASLPKECDSKSIAEVAKCIEIIRNSGWVIWGLLSIIGVGIGLWLTWWGRRVQQESHLQERFEKAADMLSSKTELTRIAACGSLMNLGKSDESMKSQCVQLLFAFIKDPYLEAEQKKKYLILGSHGKDEYLNKLFPAERPLRSDIKSAITSFCTIYKYYGMAGIDSMAVDLPSYFWKNKKKDNISLIKANLQEAHLHMANLQGADMREVNLWGADLQGAYFYHANLRKANLRGAGLQEANLCMADLQRVNFYEANLQRADMILANLRRSNLWKADLQGARLSYTKLQKAELQEAKMQRTILYMAKLQDANLYRADLEEAILEKAKFQKAILCEANFKGADLERARLQGADISRADMRKVKNLTKEQVLSAKWGYNRDRKGGVPELPEELAQDENVKKWLEKPHYDERKKPKTKAKTKAKLKAKAKAKKARGRPRKKTP